jgi:ribosomal protein S18 acetylase RimI-like enzyme
MNEARIKAMAPSPKVERITQFSSGDLNDLCDATYAAIEGGGGFGWVKKPDRGILERFWQGVLVMPARILFVARLDNVICGAGQLVKPPANNEAQSLSVQFTGHFVAPWARGHGLAKMLLVEAEKTALEEGFAVINLDVRETMTRAIQLYESMGYSRIGTHPYYAQVDENIIKGHYYYKVINSKIAKK